MTRIATTLAALILGTLATTTPADAATGCVTIREVNTVRDNMTRAQVHAIFGTPGRRAYITTRNLSPQVRTETERRRYRACDRRYLEVQANYTRKVTPAGGTKWRLSGGPYAIRPWWN